MQHYEQDGCKKIARGPHSEPRESVGLYASDGGRKYVNLAERQRALAAMAELDPDKALFALTLAWTGARVSEVLALSAASFQIERGIVAFMTLKRRRLSVREVPIPKSLMTAIDARFDLCAAQTDPARARRRLWTWHRVTAWRLLKDVMAAPALLVARPARAGFVTALASEPCKPACRSILCNAGLVTPASARPLSMPTPAVRKNRCSRLGFGIRPAHPDGCCAWLTHCGD